MGRAGGAPTRLPLFGSSFQPRKCSRSHLFLSPFLSLSLSLNLSLSQSLSVFLPLPPSLSVFLSVFLSFSLPFSLCLSLSLPPFLAPSLPLYNPIAISAHQPPQHQAYPCLTRVDRVTGSVSFKSCLSLSRPDSDHGEPRRAPRRPQRTAAQAAPVRAARGESTETCSRFPSREFPSPQRTAARAALDTQERVGAQAEPAAGVQGPSSPAFKFSGSRLSESKADCPTGGARAAASVGAGGAVSPTAPPRRESGSRNRVRWTRARSGAPDRDRRAATRAAARVQGRPGPATQTPQRKPESIYTAGRPAGRPRVPAAPARTAVAFPPGPRDLTPTVLRVGAISKSAAPRRAAPAFAWNSLRRFTRPAPRAAAAAAGRREGTRMPRRPGPCAPARRTESGLSV